VQLAVQALGHDVETPREIPPEDVEAAVLDRSRSQLRKFARLSDQTVTEYLAASVS